MALMPVPYSVFSGAFEGHARSAMSATNSKSESLRWPIMQGVLPLKAAQIPAEIVAGITLENVVKDFKQQTGTKATGKDTGPGRRPAA
jgi:hypothetical protein